MTYSWEHLRRHHHPRIFQTHCCEHRTCPSWHKGKIRIQDIRWLAGSPSRTASLEAARWRREDMLSSSRLTLLTQAVSPTVPSATRRAWHRAEAVQPHAELPVLSSLLHQPLGRKTVKCPLWADAYQLWGKMSGTWGHLPHAPSSATNLRPDSSAWRAHSVR